MKYPEYLVDMMYQYLRVLEVNGYDQPTQQSMLDEIEFEVELAERNATEEELEERNIGWYFELVQLVNKKYNRNFNMMELCA